MTRTVGVILAGGLSSRMGGGDKSLLEIGGKKLLSRVVERISPQVDMLALNANGDPDRFSYFGLPVLQDSIDGFAGPLAGVLAGLEWAAEQGADTVISVAADTPFFPEDLAGRLRQVADQTESQIVLAATRDAKRGIVRHPTFGLWPVALRHDLRAALESGLRKVVLWTDKHRSNVALFEARQNDAFFNVNTPEDLAVAQRLALENDI